MNGWLDGWPERQTDGWVDGQMDEESVVEEDFLVGWAAEEEERRQGGRVEEECALDGLTEGGVDGGKVRGS